VSINNIAVTSPDDFKADVSALSLETTVQAIKFKTDNLPADPAAASDIPNIQQELTTYGVSTSGDVEDAAFL
jgi:hypothetical protein